jgi:predicted HNH restriction endonuclease
MEPVSNPGYLSASHFLLYWKLSAEERQDLNAHLRADYAAHDLLYKVQPGDVLWLVNVHVGKLLLIGRLQVEVVVDNIEVAQDLVDPVGAWQEADWYAIANKYNVEPLREVDVTPLAEHLRFHSRSERLDLADGIDASQLRAVRRLTAQSAAPLQAAWYDQQYTPQNIADFLELSEDDQAYSEGRQVVRTMKQRQRNKQLVQDAKARFKQDNAGHLFCEVCGFDFTATYGIEYIEAHHEREMASYTDDDSTTISEMRMLCANCHRMAHTRTPPLTIDELKDRIKQRQHAAPVQEV